EVREVVAYATARNITVIPEIELPGHASAALAAYPHLGCTGGPYETAKTWGVFQDIYCVGRESTFEFLENVFEEILSLFPGPYVHIGGDEAPKSRWEECPHSQKRMQEEGLKDEHELQSYFVQRIEAYLNSQGKTMIGWDEILEGGLAPNAVVMSWRGEEGGIAAAQQNHPVIMTPVEWCYFDYYQADMETEPLAIKQLTTVEKVYGYEPIPSGLTEKEASLVLGAQCNLWSEYITSGEHAEYMVYPRALAMAEVLWSPAGKRDYDQFVERVGSLRPLLDTWDINYATHIFQSIATSE
ncbi:MAG TPA: beta-N-acetylglucosaminidase, partial [Cytophagales bacterium]|nr:beta-N-acetylglucosaminidase [Cytophagales bacterium]